MKTLTQPQPPTSSQAGEEVRRHRGAQGADWGGCGKGQGLAGGYSRLLGEGVRGGRGGGGLEGVHGEQ